MLLALNTYNKQQAPLKSACFYLLHYAGAIAGCVWKKSIFNNNKNQLDRAAACYGTVFAASSLEKLNSLQEVTSEIE